MRVLLLAAAGAVRGQLDAGLRSRIRFPPQLPGRHVVWEGHPRVGLGNVLAGWGDLYYKAIVRDTTVLVGLDHAITRDLARFFALGVDNETTGRQQSWQQRPGRVRSGLVYDGFVDAVSAERFNVSTAHCRPGKLQVKQSLAGDYGGSFSFEPERALPCGLREALRALIKGPGVGFRKARTKLSKGWDGDAQRLDALLTRPPSSDSPIYVAAVHVAPSAAIKAPRHRRDVNHLTHRSVPSSARWRTAPTSARTRASRALRRAPGSGPRPSSSAGPGSRARSRASAAAATRARFLCRRSRLS